MDKMIETLRQYEAGLITKDMMHNIFFTTTVEEALLRELQKPTGDTIRWPARPPVVLDDVHIALTFIRNSLGNQSDDRPTLDEAKVIEAVGTHVEASLEILADYPCYV